jgi:DNA-binding XRE family transcriptional regulator
MFGSDLRTWKSGSPVIGKEPWWTGVYAVGIVGPVTGKEFRRVRQHLKLTQNAIAEQLGVTANSVARWERGERAISEPVARLVRLLATKTRSSSRRRG